MSYDWESLDTYPQFMRDVAGDFGEDNPAARDCILEMATDIEILLGCSEMVSNSLTNSI